MIEIPIIGMSPGNSYFKDEVVKELLKKVVEQYGKAVVMIADIPAISTYVALGYPEAEVIDEDVWKALEAAQLSEFIKTLPNGLNTQTGDRGTRWSGGQRQRYLQI